MRVVPTSLLLLALAGSSGLAQQISQSPLIGHKAGAACTHGPYPSPAGADNVSGYGLAGCLPHEAERLWRPVPGGEAVAARQSAAPASTAPQPGLFSTLHNVER